jgi:indolepyruvate ferredoxin oxidoreductase beta subunit
MLKYPSLDEIREKIHVFTKRVVTINAKKLAEEAGNVLTRNLVLIGALAAMENVPLNKESILQALEALVPSRYLDVNIQAFKLGYEFAKKSGKP